ncbi:MAG TPA: hypothetical protein VGO55_03100 [Allosphingosinicella sp.]|jgi:hypothetical protein|nr:hypothetical protein [Allosphingosinicella sp.]
MTRRYRQPREPKVCLVKGCGSIIESWKVLCDTHFRALPWATRDAIREAREAQAPHIVSKLMSDGAAALAARAGEVAAAAAAQTARMMGERE